MAIVPEIRRKRKSRISPLFKMFERKCFKKNTYPSPEKRINIAGNLRLKTMSIDGDDKSHDDESSHPSNRDTNISLWKISNVDAIYHHQASLKITELSTETKTWNAHTGVIWNNRTMCIILGYARDEIDIRSTAPFEQSCNGMSRLPFLYIYIFEKNDSLCRFEHFHHI